MTMRIFPATVICFLILGCSTDEKNQIKNTMPPGSTISDVLHKHTPAWMKIPGVIGTGEGELDGRPCILVFVVKKSEEIAQKIPDVVEGYSVMIQETGEVKPMEKP